ncbi:MAG: hypothetical protein P4L33_02020 [Capsulimonadaceae bacterium]|nr:hypothetical protein [Capsulimonadaceae bacterium]
MINPSAKPARSEDPADIVPKKSGTIVTIRSFVTGLLLSILVDYWIQAAELIMGQRQGHTALANTAIPVGPFSVFFVVAAINILCRAALPGFAYTTGEMITVYVMMTTSCVLSSSGQLQFLIPTITAAWHYATTENHWGILFFRFIPHWLAQTDPDVLDGFYKGGTKLPVLAWAPQIAAWAGFMTALAGASFCIVAILRRRWVDQEKLSFPTVALPLAIANQESSTPIFREKLFWLAFLIPFAVSAVNTLSLNQPAIPIINLRSAPMFPNIVLDRPWSALGDLRISFYPFVIGIAYFAPLEVSFSCWFFYLLTLAQKVVGSAAGYDTMVKGAHHASFPYIGNQGAGAFIGLALVSIVSAWPHIKQVFLKAIGRNPSMDDSEEPVSYRFAVVGLILCVAFMAGFSIKAGMSPLFALIVIGLGLTYMIAATRIRAETGDAWLFGPECDVNTLMTSTLGSQLLSAPDLTILAYLRPVLANFDLRCITMPHQLEAFKMAQELNVSRRKVAGAIILATVVGIVVSFFITLSVWHAYGAEARTEPWRTLQGRFAFDSLADTLRTRSTIDIPGLGAVGFGILVTAALSILRMRFVWWPFHPVGYAVANTSTMGSVWVPFLLAWLVKTMALRYGGAKFYRQTQPFFLGLIAGDLIGGGFFTALGAFTGINVYPINW